uniref:Disease resistance protein winged helix domain-containing protein n=2 Tax=Nelumbo nucifera TaxID=4432 RepID=A0A822Z911_NELNU|nr:TPA_asm: hypothetical protein HUJ06_013889 [Nelumbo nucifera]
MIKKIHRTTKDTVLLEGVNTMEEDQLIDILRNYLQLKRESSSHVYDLKPLSDGDAWKLFYKNAFPSFNFESQCSPDLEEFPFKILKRCECLPLAIVTIASLLSLKYKTVQEWKKLHDSLGPELEINPILGKFNKVLLLSYNNLPYHLKHCFLYFSILLEDYAITSMRLGRLWITEAFVEETRGKTLEEVAEDYLNELIRRNLVQMVEMNDSG